MIMKYELAKNELVTFGKTEDMNVVIDNASGDVIAEGWFESLEDGWYMTSDKLEIFQEFFGGDCESVADFFATEMVDKFFAVDAKVDFTAGMTRVEGGWVMA